MAIYPKLRAFDILRDVETRLSDKNCPLYNKRDDVLKYIFIMNCSYITLHLPTSLDAFVSEDGIYDIYITLSSVNEGYCFYYTESEKYKLLEKMGG